MLPSIFAAATISSTAEECSYFAMNPGACFCETSIKYIVIGAYEVNPGTGEVGFLVDQAFERGAEPRFSAGEYAAINLNVSHETGRPVLLSTADGEHWLTTYLSADGMMQWFGDGRSTVNGVSYAEGCHSPRSASAVAELLESVPQLECEDVARESFNLQTTCRSQDDGCAAAGAMQTSFGLMLVVLLTAMSRRWATRRRSVSG